MNYREIIDEIKDITKTLTIIEGIVDIHYQESNDFFEIKDCTNSFWTIVGNAPEEDIKECLEDEYYEKYSGLELEGEYHFDAVLKYENSDDYRGGWYIEYIEFHFHQTFLEREREEKLFNLLDSNPDIFP